MSFTKVIAPGSSCLAHVGGAPYRHRKMGYISDFESTDGIGAQRLLAAAMDALRQQDCDYVVGPIKKDSWGDYRFVTWSDGRPAFPMEPSNPEWYPQVFEAMGFEAVETYSSSIDENPSAPAKVRSVPGITLAQWDDTRAAEDLDAIRNLTDAAFESAPFFRPADSRQFVSRYGPLLKSADPRYCLLARDAAGTIVAYLLAYRSAPGELVLKTVASVARGAGAMLVDEFYRRAAEDGFTAVIHALMHDGNRSTGMSRKARGRVFRRYAVFGRELKP